MGLRGPGGWACGGQRAAVLLGRVLTWVERDRERVSWAAWSNKAEAQVASWAGGVKEGRGGSAGLVQL